MSTDIRISVANLFVGIAAILVAVWLAVYSGWLQSLAGVPHQTVHVENGPIPLRVEISPGGQLSAAKPVAEQRFDPADRPSGQDPAPQPSSASRTAIFPPGPSIETAVFVEGEGKPVLGGHVTLRYLGPMQGRALGIVSLNTGQTSGDIYFAPNSPVRFGDVLVTLVEFGQLAPQLPGAAFEFRRVR